MADETDDPYESTTRWVQEAARRQPVRQQEIPTAVKAVAGKRRRGRRFAVGREIYMFAVLAALYLNYYFMQVVVEIDSLPSMVVFVSHGGIPG